MRASIVLNDAISVRGPSGTARATELICRALVEAGHDLARVRPPLRRNRVARALQFATWDFYGPAGHRGDVVISPANTGRAGDRRPHVLWVHDTMVLDRPDLFARRYAVFASVAFNLSIASATIVVVPSEYSARQLMMRWPEAEPKLRVVPWPYVGPVADRPRDRPRSPLRVLMLGSTEPYKRHQLGIEVARLARILTGTDLRLTIAGPRGRDEEQVLATAGLVDPEARWIQRAFLADRKEVDRALRDADVLLQCSSMEGFCLPLIEAAGSGLPVVHTGGGAMSEVHPPGNAQTDEPEVLAKQLVGLMQPQKYAWASAQGLELIARFDWGTFVASVARVVEEACETRRTARE